MDEVERDRLEKWRSNSWFLFNGNAPAHRPVLVKDFLNEEQSDSIGAFLILS